MRGRHLGLAAAGVTAFLVGGLPAAAVAQDDAVALQAEPAETTGAAPHRAGSHPALPVPPPPTGPKRAHLSLHLHGLHHGRIQVGQRARAVGYLRPYVADQHVAVKLLRRGHVIQKLNPVTRKVRGKNAGRFNFNSPGLMKPGSYRIVARHAKNAKQRAASARSPKFQIRYPDLDPGDRSGATRLFNRLLLGRGYYTTHGRHYGSKTGFAVMAFRKVNGMKRSFNASPQIFKQLADGRGRFRLRYPGAGRHVEVDISRQVMVLASHGKARYTFHVSTGASATPTIRGHYHFYSRQPGFNSHGMYYSVYWHGGYAIHGYASVPPYPASHGCVRNEIPESKFIYNWVDLGMSIYVYG